MQIQFKSYLDTIILHALDVRILAHQYSRTLTAVAAMALMGTGATAYAVASASKSQTDLFNSVTQVVEPVEHQASVLEPEAYDFALYRTDKVNRSDSNASLLKRLGVQDAQALKFINQDAAAKKLSSYDGQTVEVKTDAQGLLQSLLLRYPQDDKVRFTRLSVKRQADGKLVANEETGYLKAQEEVGYATVRSTVYGAMDAADIPDTVGNQLIDIFSSQIDFQRNLHRGDSFKIVYESLLADGEKMATGRVLGAEFINGKKLYSAVWFQAAGSAGGYYNLDGESLRKAYLASPLKFSRVTSGFGMRQHPIWNSKRQHKGVDYGASSGTPIMAVADGTVVMAGTQNGYGNAVEVKHANGRSTFYAHMSRIDVRRGEKVSQGSLLGAVGSTGWATGPHLHFEFRINGDYQDPDLMAGEAGTVPLQNARERKEFAALSQDMRTQFASARDMQFASAE